MGLLSSRPWRARVVAPREGDAAGEGGGGGAVVALRGSGGGRGGAAKRKRAAECPTSDSESDGESEREERLLNTPRRKKLKSTSRYIYQTLFLNGENSDIKICALGEEWNLHKIYLCQSGYFSSMFSGSWKESGMDTIELEIPDQNIDIEALQVAFGSLYRDEVLINPSRVIALLAAASMLQLDGLIQQCGETMKETINVKTVCSYYNSAGTYGLDSVKKKCLEWLLNNLMTHQSVELFKELSIVLMKQLISSSNLFVMQVEMDVYTALKKWMFLQLVPSWNGSLKQLLSEADAWFSKRRKDFEDGVSFLESEQGSAFLTVFRHLRLQYIVSDLASAKIVERDSLIPAGLRKRTRKNLKETVCDVAENLQRMVMLRLASFDGSGKLICSRTAGYQILTLEKDQEQVVMNLDSRLLLFPLYICCNFLYTSPEKRAENEGQPDSL
ncbi:germ cell-less protein-like 1 isoform X2 [Hemicordylus capensis]|uniref:germ cell-less protein-like 1 isoform X2 n=1 Tax=Hemicordylus capensis TaxID=884348 RepID=UPI0023039A72|nr:germ cell-less protein-like 1 isoform X2 [Hemicordylus capensis]